MDKDLRVWFVAEFDTEELSWCKYYIDYDGCGFI
jgi:hypothetical protein